MGPVAAPGIVLLGCGLVGLVVVVAAASRRPVVAAALVLFAVGALSISLRVTALHAEPLTEWVSQHRHVVVVGVLTADPDVVVRQTFGGGDTRQVRVELRAEQIRSGTTSLQVRAPLLVVGDASGWQDLRLGDRVATEGSLQPAPAARPLTAVLFGGVPDHLSPAPPLLRGTESMRAGLRTAVTGTGGDVEGLLPALVVGDTSALPPLLVADLRDSGLAHLTAVSGANVAIVVGAGLLLARWVGVRGYALLAVGVASVVWFVLLARPEPSVLRAAVMGSVALVGVAAAGRGQALRALLVSVVALLLVDPWLARSWGFALSVAATGGLVVLARRLSGVMPAAMPSMLRDGMAVAVAAQLATLPLVVALSGKLAVLSVLANVVTAPAVPAATVLGAAAAVLSPVADPLAHACAWLAQWPTAWIAWVAHRAATAPVATLPWPAGWVGAALAAAVLVGAWAFLGLGHRRRLWSSRRMSLLATLTTLVLAAYVLGPGRWPPVGWVMVACDVGQGDALVVRLDDRSALVVDAGPDPALVDRCLDQLGVERVPLLVLTHFHADHVAGVPGVLDGRGLGTVLVSPVHDPPEQVADVGRWAVGHPVVEAEPGQVGSVGDVRWRVLWPTASPPTEGSAANNASIVLLVRAAGLRLLLTGDVEPPAQAQLLAAGGVPQADVLKVPHHGSRHQDPAFLAATGARVAVISVGADNPYGHPAEELLAALESSGVLVARTDVAGDVAVVNGSRGLRVQALP